MFGVSFSELLLVGLIALLVLGPERCLLYTSPSPRDS